MFRNDFQPHKAGAGTPGRYRHTPPETDAAGNPALPPGRPALHFAEIQPGNVEVGFPLPAGIPQDNQHQGKQAQPPCHLKGIAGHFPLHPDAVAGKGKPPDPPLHKEGHKRKRQRTAQQSGAGAGSAE